MGSATVLSFPNLAVHQNHLESLKHFTILGSTPEDSNSVGLGGTPEFIEPYKQSAPSLAFK